MNDYTRGTFEQDGITPVEYIYLIQAIEKDEFPILLAGDWITKERTLDLIKKFDEQKGRDQ